MKIHYYKSTRGNFGDDINPSFFKAICPNYEHAKKERLIGIGTLLNSSIGEIRNSIIFGSGYGQGRPATIDHSTTEVLGVRGPITAMSLGIDPEHTVIGDPVLYIPRIEQFNKGIAKKGKYVFALHHRTAEYWNFNESKSTEFVYLDPATTKINDYIATIKQAELVFAESLHGAIVASAYQVPFIRTGLLNRVDETKWLDFFLSLMIDRLPECHFAPPPFNLPGRRHILAMIGRKLLPYSAFGIGHQCVSQNDIQRIEKSAKSFITKANIIITPSQRLLELQNRCELAIEGLLKLTKGDAIQS